MQAPAEHLRPPFDGAFGVEIHCIPGWGNRKSSQTTMMMTGNNFLNVKPKQIPTTTTTTTEAAAQKVMENISMAAVIQFFSHREFCVWHFPNLLSLPLEASQPAFRM